MRSLSPFLACSMFLVSWASPIRSADAPGQLAFTMLSDEETGLKAIITKWKDDETKRQPKKLSWWPWGVAAFDFDNDGQLDLIAQQHAAPGSIILRGKLSAAGVPTFTNVSDELGVGGAVLPGTFKPHITDVDGDGWLDIVGTDAQPNTCWFNKGGKKFEPMKFGFGQLAGLDVVPDLNGDGIPDIVSVREGSRFLFDPMARTFRKSAYLPPLHANPPMCIAEFLRTTKEKNRFMAIRFFEGTDLNSDGLPDLVVGGFGPYGGESFGRYLIADKSGGFADRSAELGLPTEGTPVLVSDLTGDGKPAILVAVGPKAGLYLGDGKGAFARQDDGPLRKFLTGRDSYNHKVIPADLNNDGRVDLILSSPRLGMIEVYESQGAGQFCLALKARGWDSDPIAVADFNHDGLLDVAIGGPGDTITIYQNATAQAGRSCKITVRMPSPNPFAVGANVQVFRAGELGTAGARPLWAEAAHADGSPIHVGLVAAAKFDLRVTFPGKLPSTVERKGIAVTAKLQIAPSEIVAE